MDRCGVRNSLWESSVGIYTWLTKVNHTKKSTFKCDINSDLENNAKPGTELHDWKGTYDHCGTK